MLEATITAQSVQPQGEIPARRKAEKNTLEKFTMTEKNYEKSKCLLFISTSQLVLGTQFVGRNHYFQHVNILFYHKWKKRKKIHKI